MRRRNPKMQRTALVLTGLVGVAAVTAALVPQHVAEAVPQPVTAARPDAASIEAGLDALERQADAAGAAAQQADEALNRSDTAANRAAVDAAESALRSLASEQAPRLAELGREATALGLSTTAQGDGTTATTAALTGRTRALKAVSFAKRQIGDPYRYAAAGPGRWDCSGLTMKAYGAVRIGIGGHSATAQYDRARAEHRLVAYGHRKPGDLIFYGRPGAVYHVAIYAGHGRMIEAPYPGKSVREVAVRGAGRLAVVGRPA